MVPSAGRDHDGGCESKPGSADSGFSQTTPTQIVESGSPSRSPEAGGGLVNEGRRFVPGQAGRFVWRRAPGGLAHDGGRAPSRGGRPTPASRGPGRSPRGGSHSSQISQELDGGREVALVDLLDQLGGVPSNRTDPATPRLPVPINLEAWVMVIMERARPE